MTTFTITTALQVPRTDDSTDVPMTWTEDHGTDLAARGFLYEILTCAVPGVEVTEATVSRRHPSDPPVADMLAGLVRAGYLIPAGGDRFVLVHPDRLPPLPSGTGE
jgi:hypothetical protein